MPDVYSLLLEQFLKFIILKDEVIELLSQSMAKMPDAPGFLIDGFPANMVQADIFVSKIQAPHKIIFLNVPEAMMGPRLKDGVNFNDSDETIKKRIFTYLEQTKPTVDLIIKKWKTSCKIVSLMKFTTENFIEVYKKINKNIQILPLFYRFN